MSLTATITFEGGTDGTALVVGDEGSAAVSNMAYETDAAVHGAMGVRVVAGVTGALGWTVPSSGQASVYWPGYTVAATNSVLYTLRDGSSFRARLRANVTTGVYELTDVSNVLLASSTVGLNGLLPARADWRWQFNSGTSELTVEIRLFIGANVEGTVADDVIGPVTYSVTTAPNRFYIGTTTASWTIYTDTVRLYDDVVTWPEPFVASIPDPTVVYTMVGNTTNTTARIRAKVQDSTVGSVKCYYSVNSDLSSPSFTAAQAVDANGYVTFDLTGLTGGTTYYYNFLDVDGATETPFGTNYSFRTSTNPAGTSQLKLAISSCLQTDAPNDHSALLDIAAWNPHRFIHLGDAYYDGVSTSTSVNEHRGRWEGQIGDVADWKTLLGSVSLVYINSDHELNPDNSDTLGSATALSFNEFYRQTIPSFPLVVTGTNPVSKHQSWVDSNIRFILIDIRNTQRSAGADTDGPSKTMLGASQLAWLLSELDQPELLKVILCDVPWTHSANTASQFQDKWCSYANERQIIADHITSNGINVDFFHGDSHRLSVDETHNLWGGFPYASCSSLSQDSGGTQYNGLFDQTYPTEGGGTIILSAYMRVTYDWLDSDTLQRTASGWDAINDIERVSMVTTWVRGAAPVTTTYINVGGVATPVSTFINVAGTAVETAPVTVAP